MQRLAPACLPGEAPPELPLRFGAGDGAGGLPCSCMPWRDEMGCALSLADQGTSSVPPHSLPWCLQLAALGCSAKIKPCKWRAVCAPPAFGDLSEQEEAKSIKIGVIEDEQATACGTGSRKELFTSWPLAQASSAAQLPAHMGYALVTWTTMKEPGYFHPWQCCLLSPLKG